MDFQYLGVDVSSDWNTYKKKKKQEDSKEKVWNNIKHSLEG